MTVQKALAEPAEGDGFIAVRPGSPSPPGGSLQVLRDLEPAAPLSFFVLEEGAPDLRDAVLAGPDPVFFFGDHLGFHEASARACPSSAPRPWASAR